MRHAFGWRGRSLVAREQVANACDDFVDLSPVSDAAAEAVEAGWSAWLPYQDVPLIWERVHGGEQEDEFC